MKKSVYGPIGGNRFKTLSAASGSAGSMSEPLFYSDSSESTELVFEALSLSVPESDALCSAVTSTFLKVNNSPT